MGGTGSVDGGAAGRAGRMSATSLDVDEAAPSSAGETEVGAEAAPGFVSTRARSAGMGASLLADALARRLGDGAPRAVPVSGFVSGAAFEQGGGAGAYRDADADAPVLSADHREAYRSDAAWIKGATPAEVAADAKKRLAKHPGAYWDMMNALRYEDPAAYEKAMSACATLFREAPSADIARWLSTAYEVAPTFLAKTLQNLGTKDPIALAKVVAALPERLNKIDWEAKDLGFVDAVRGLSGPGADLVKSAALRMIAKRDGRLDGKGDPVSGYDLDVARYRIRMSTDADGLIRELIELSKQAKAGNQGGYREALDTLKRIGISARADEPLFDFVHNLQLFARGEDGARLKADIASELFTEMKRWGDPGIQDIEGRERRGELASLIGDLVDDPGVASYFLSSDERAKEFDAILTGVLKTGDDRGKRVAGELVKRLAHEAANAFDPPADPKAVGEAGRRLGWALRTCEDALKKGKKDDSIARFLLGKVADELIKLIPGAGTVTDLAKKGADWLARQAIDKLLEEPTAGETMDQRLMRIAEAIYHAKRDPDGMISSRDPLDPLRKQYEGDFQTFKREVLEGYGWTGKKL